MFTINGNLLNLALEGEFDIVVHNCNCSCVMTGELAKKITLAFPKVATADMHSGTCNFEKLGTWSETDEKTRNGDVFKIVNAYTQFVPGRDLRLSAVVTVFEKLNMMFPGATVGIPLVKESISGLKWRTVKKAIKAVTKDLNIIIVKH